MNNDQFLQQIQQYVTVADNPPGEGSGVRAVCDYAGGPQIVSWQPQACEECGLEVAGPRTRVHVRLRVSGWRERCEPCGQYRNPATGEFGAAVSTKPSSVQQKKQLQPTLLKSQPPEPDPTLTKTHVAESECSEQDLVLDALVHPGPDSHDPVDHLRLDIVVHKVKHVPQD